MKRFGLFSLLALSVSAGLWGSGPAAADVVINGDYYEETKSANCPVNLCTLELTPIGASRVLFTKMNCLISVSSANAVYLGLGVRDTSGSATTRRLEYLPLAEGLAGASNTKFYTSYTPTDFLFASGKIPTILAGLNGVTGTINCKLSGRIQS